MNRYELAHSYHKRGFNCCQSVVAAFSDLTGLSEQESFNVGGGFGGGAGTGELCGALVGGIMALGLMTPVDESDPVASKKRTQAKGKKLQKKFMETFGALRCQDLLRDPKAPAGSTAAATAMGLTGHCDIMIVTAVEIVADMLAERE